MSPFVAALASIAMSVAAQFCMRHGMQQPPWWTASGPGGPGPVLESLARPWVLAGLAAYAAGALVWLRVLADWEVSRAYPLVGLGFVLSAGIGYLLGEAVTPVRLFGALLIAAGVALIGRG